MSTTISPSKREKVGTIARSVRSDLIENGKSQGESTRRPILGGVKVAVVPTFRKKDAVGGTCHWP